MTLGNQPRPRLWIVAGPNGCGKSTAYSQGMIADFDASVWIVNPDLLTATLRDEEGLELAQANLQAVKRIERWLRNSILVHQTVGVETVLSTGKYRKLVRLAKKLGFEIRLIYVIVASVEIQLERIRLRVQKGGHDVPAAKVAERRTRSLGQLPWFFGQADYAWIIDNSSAEPQIVVQWDPESFAVSDPLMPELGSVLFGWDQ